MNLKPWHIAALITGIPLVVFGIGPVQSRPSTMSDIEERVAKLELDVLGLRVDRDKCKEHIESQTFKVVPLPPPPAWNKAYHSLKVKK